MTPNMKSNILFDGTVFDPASVSADTNAFKEYLMDVSTKGPKWYEVSSTQQNDLLGVLPQSLLVVLTRFLSNCR